MARFSLLHPLLLSFYSRALYRDVGRNWKGIGFLYLLLLLSLSWLLWTADLHRKVGEFVEVEAPGIIEQIPSISIREGRVSVEAPQPYIIEIPEDPPWRFVIDTTGTTTSLEAGTKMLLTSSELIVRRSVTETRVYDLSQVRRFDLDRERFAGWVEFCRAWFAILVFPFMLGSSFAYRVAQVMIYGTIGMAFARQVGAGLDYYALLRLAAVSITPVIWLDTLVGMSGLSVPFWWPICFFIAMGYLLFAVKANAGAHSDERFSAPPSGIATLSK